MGVYRKYQHQKFTRRSEELIEAINEIIAAEEANGLSMSVRQIHYQLVNRPDYENTAENVNSLGNLISNARMAGLISWTAIEDRTRPFYDQAYTEHPRDVFKGLDEGFKLNKWREQDFMPEVWVEKESQIDVIGQICNILEVPFYACKGYNSQSMAWRAGRRMQRYARRGQRPIIFHLGDLDPSGWDIDPRQPRAAKPLRRFPGERAANRIEHRPGARVRAAPQPAEARRRRQAHRLARQGLPR